MRVPDDPEPQEPAQRAAVAVVKAWIEGDPPANLRVKVMAAPLTAGGEPAELGTAASIGDACALVGDWLERFVATSPRSRRLSMVHPPAPGRDR
jgi:hypothetical protein